MRKELEKTYSPKDFEDRLYKYWEDAGYFHAPIDPEKKPRKENRVFWIE